MSNKWYHKLSWKVRLIIAIIPPVSYFVHAIARITSGKTINMVLGVLSFFGLGFVFWLLDLICFLLGMKMFFMD